MTANNFTSMAQLETYYVDHVLQYIGSMKRTPLVWEEVFDNGAKITPDTVVDVWKGGWQATMGRVTAKGYRAVLSHPWYLNYHDGTSFFPVFLLLKSLTFYLPSSHCSRLESLLQD